MREQKYQAIVKTITGFGAFVELMIEGVEGVEGLVHISQLSEGELFSLFARL